MGKEKTPGVYDGNQPPIEGQIPESDPVAELNHVKEQMSALEVSYAALKLRKLELEKLLGVKKRLNKYPIMGEESLLERNKLYCDFDELFKYDKRALRNHTQTLEQMANRGGMGLHEVYALVTDTSYSDAARMDKRQMINYLREAGILKEDPG